ncbi:MULTISPECIES: hypothetical protein [Corynebacterium]|uniref:hypothetical protein n=1 Tax=Corynebacterium TaxID=1716 RepID=UPI001EF3A8E8|nr:MULTISPECIES: hypothetical protein [Corynebacterium]
MKRALAALVLASCAGLSAGCGSQPGEDPSSTAVTPPAVTSSAAPADDASPSATATGTADASTADTSATGSSTAATRTTESPSSSTTKRSTSSSTEAEDAVATVATTFASLAPASFFADLENCHPNGIPDSYSCDGPKVGQFQFFASDVKATSTAQVLRELSSSRVVEEQAPRIVGWSVLGSTAIITVVDEKKGLTMQQMISSDKVDPSTRIKELGLVESD